MQARPERVLPFVQIPRRGSTAGARHGLTKGRWVTQEQRPELLPREQATERAKMTGYRRWPLAGQKLTPPGIYQGHRRLARQRGTGTIRLTGSDLAVAAT